ncbi:hypothetical protein ADK55_07820 [Streptomyces sp. WM4235]|nr:hypothetical protein ADK55_07820 [Streptomyces sp. WM4235]
MRDTPGPAATASWIAVRARATSSSRYAWARLMPNSAAQYDSQLPCPRGSQTRAACASRTRAASTATERRTSAIASRNGL